MRNRILYILSVGAALLLHGCKEDIIEPEVVPLSFKTEVTQLTYNCAKVRVTHTGNEDVTWYAFHTTDVKKSDRDLLVEEYRKLLQDPNFRKKLYKTQDRIFIIEGLKAETRYKFIVFGVKEDGELYDAQMSIADFTTPINIYTLKKTDVWKITHESKRTAKRDYEEISVLSTRDAGYCDVSVVSEEAIKEWEAEYPDGFEMWDNDVLMYTLKSGIEFYVMQNIYNIQDQLGYSDISTLGLANSLTTPAKREIDRLRSGKHYVLAVGYSKSGQHTQEYSIKEIVIREDATATPEYLKWNGTYELTGKTEVREGDVLNDEKEVKYTLRIQGVDNNHMYKVTGWECGDDIKEENKWNADVAEKGFYAYLMKDGKLEIRESTIGNLTIDNVKHTLGIFGYGFNVAYNAETPVFYEGNPMAEAEPIKEGEDATTLKPKKFKYSYYDVDMTIKTEEVEYSKFGMIAVNMNNWSYMSKNPALKFPMTLKKISE